MKTMENKEVLQLTKTDLLGSAGAAAVLTAFIVFLASALV
ncbi:DUF3948 family protein [Bacillus cereus]|nr:MULTISPECIES: DUF3948 family protein [unclassified Bacillus (in: firmicutes)]